MFLFSLAWGALWFDIGLDSLILHFFVLGLPHCSMLLLGFPVPYQFFWLFVSRGFWSVAAGLVLESSIIVYPRKSLSSFSSDTFVGIARKLSVKQ